MDWKVETADPVERDLEAIFDHLLDSHLTFGNSLAEAIALAEQRVDSIFTKGLGLKRTPFRGTRHSFEGDEFRHTTIDRAIYWFRLDEARKTVVLEGVFHGGQDHLNRMLTRLAADGIENDEGA